MWFTAGERSDRHKEGEWNLLEVVGPSILQQKLETRWNIVFLMDKKAFGALRSSQSSLSSLQENSSGLCLNEKLDLLMSSPRNSSGFGESGCSLSWLCCVALHTCSATSSLFFRLGAGWTGVCGKQLFWVLMESWSWKHPVCWVWRCGSSVFGTGVLSVWKKPQSLFWKNWLWHPLVAVGKVLSVRSRGGLVQLNLPSASF